MILLADKIAAFGPMRRVMRASDRIVGWADDRLVQRTVWSLAVAFLLTLQMLLIFFHRPWLDEWQALQLALQSPTFADLLWNLRYEGHPPLWYLLLRTIAGVVSPYIVLPIAAALLAFVAQTVLMLGSPFSRAERLLLASGCLMMFEFMTLARGLTLGVALLIVTIALRHSRWMWISLALLPMCDFLFGALSMVILILAWRECRLWWQGTFLWLVSSAVSAWTVRPAPDSIAALKHQGLVGDSLDFVSRSGILLVPLQWGGHGPMWNGTLPLGLGGILGVLFFLFASTQLRRDRLSQALFWGFSGLTIAFTVAVYPLPNRYLMLIALLLIVLVWRLATMGCKPSAGFRAWLIVGSCCGMFVAAWNLAVPFDTEDAAAHEIVRRGLADKHWMVFPESRAQGISALTGIMFERTEVRCMQNFIHWNFQSRIETPLQLTEYLREEVLMRGRFYLLSDMPLANSLPSDLVRPIVHIASGYDGFNYYLFVVGPAFKFIPGTLPRCVPNQRPL